MPSSIRINPNVSIKESSSHSHIASTVFLNIFWYFINPQITVKEECETFFKELNSPEYIKKLETEPIQYLIKVGYGSHRAQGVFLLDTNQTAYIKRQYSNGELCGQNTRSLIAQTYVTNPLLLDFQNKFDFRVYMLVASTNPLVMYYHDGFLRVSLHPYDKYSNDVKISIRALWILTLQSIEKHTFDQYSFIKGYICWSQKAQQNSE